MFRNGIIFFGLMVATSAAGFAISLSHDALIKQQRLSAVSPRLDVTPASDPIQALKPVAAKPAAVAVMPETGAAPVRTLAQSPVDTIPTPAAPISTNGFPSFGTSAPAIPTVVPYLDQSAAPTIATVRPRMRDEAADIARSLPVTTVPDRMVRIEPAPLAMNLPVYPYNPGSTHSGVSTTKTKIIPAPRYLIGVYR